MKFNKIIALALIVALCAAFASCDLFGGNESSVTESSKPAVDQSSKAESVPDEVSVVTESSEPAVESSEPAVESSEPAVESSEPAVESSESADESSGDETSAPDDGPRDTAEAIVALAQKLIGTEYKLGGVGPDTFDNSGFVYYVCRQNGVKAPRLVGGMMEFGTEVSREDLLPGDIVVFRNELDGPPAFEGIYVGDNNFIACNKEGTPTKLQTIGNYWSVRFVCGRRVS